MGSKEDFIKLNNSLSECLAAVSPVLHNRFLFLLVILIVTFKSSSSTRVLTAARLMTARAVI